MVVSFLLSINMELDRLITMISLLYSEFKSRKPVGRQLPVMTFSQFFKEANWQWKGLINIIIFITVWFLIVNNIFRSWWLKVNMCFGISWLCQGYASHVIRNEHFVPNCWLPSGSCKSGIINMMKPESYGVSIRPLKVVEQGPHKIPSYICSLPMREYLTICSSSLPQRMNTGKQSSLITWLPNVNL